MVQSVVLLKDFYTKFCQNLDKDLHNYENKLFASRDKNVIYVIFSTTPFY